MSRGRAVSLACATLAAMLGCVLCLPLRADDPSPELPKLKSGWPALNYPEEARRQNQPGRVLVVFEISPQGHVLDPRITSAEPQGVFDAAVLAYVHALEFDVPGDWEASGGAHQEFYFGFVFRLRPCREPCEELLPFPADRSIIVTGQAPGSAPGH